MTQHRFTRYLGARDCVLAQLRHQPDAGSAERGGASIFADLQSPDALRAAYSPAHLRRRFRAHAKAHFYDESGAATDGLAIYTLSDPRDIGDVRYVGQTRSPQRRFLQHLRHAQLWVPDELPWWVKQPKLRPLYTWIRELYREEYRLPVMVVTAWAASVAEARAIERARIFEYLTLRRALLNVETEILRGQIPLL